MDDGGEHQGQWEVRTHFADYVLDFEASTATRRPARAAGEELGCGAVALRRDGEPVPMLGCGPLQVGMPLELVLLLQAGTLTRRTTSPVRSLHQLRG